MGAYSKRIDDELVELVKNGDHAAFTEIYNRYWPLLFLHVQRMVKDEDLAGDVVQEIFTWIWQRAPILDFNCALSSYLYTAARNKVFNLIRHQKIQVNYFKDIAAFIEEGNYHVDEELRYKELLNTIESEIDRMPPRMREIFNLSRKEHLSHKEIAMQLEISESTVREQVKRALKVLRLKVEDPYSLLFIMLYLLH
ncbi:RNA polymerase sigma factor [Pedobacter caeni]|uniref:RNA polymerase sigma-70 factor, ECF subfamily n=1 Tax=Pedobacter caeni TaxID=288992 RepID=A0A1M5BLH6_9SPHI|nr:RNA polymerase sigma-70 factor [Pedobacter caeni]SHF43255.1 RNA polymerase sigma-70 factor, ECF subfamily [Pedobacter caeni]